MSIGLEHIPLVAMGMGIDWVNATARFVSSLPGSSFFVPATSVWALVCVGTGALFLCLWQGRLRWLGLIPLVIGLVQPWQAASPHVLVNETAEVVAVR